MLSSALVSSLHIASIAVVMTSAFIRARALRAPRDTTAARDDAWLNRVFRADNVYGLAALALYGSGLWRAFGGLEKGTYYYLNNHMFWAKVSLLALTGALEMYPMATFIRWRIWQKKGMPVDTSRALWFARLTEMEIAGVVLIIVTASLMARGIGYGGG